MTVQSAAQSAEQSIENPPEQQTDHDGKMSSRKRIQNSADDMALDDLLSLPLEQLLELPVLSATSRQKESFVESPGIVSYITEQDIQKLGGNSLLDLLRRLPNIDSPALYLFRDNIVSVRGQHSTSTDTRMLLLLNGRPMRESYNGGVNSPVYDGFPLSSIAWIEIIRGPGSVLHGSSAFSGVINIVTKQADHHQTQISSSASYGSFGTRQIDASATHQSGELSLSSGLKIHHSDGWRYKAYDGSHEDGISHHDRGDYGQQLAAVTLGASYQDFRLDYFESHNNNDILGTTPDWPMVEAELDRRFINLGHKLALNPQWRVETNLTYNHFDSFTGAENKTGSEDYLLELTVLGQLHDKLSLIAGSTREKLTWYRENWPSDHGADFSNRSYGELVWRPWNTMRLAVGAQYNEAPGASANTSPRFAATFRFTDHWGAKLLYGEAFRAAIQLERFANIPGIFVGEEELEPETIETTDIQLYYYADNLVTALTWYQSREHDTIALDFASKAPLSSYDNAEGYRYEGVEWELNWYLNEKTQLIGSYSFQTNEDDNDREGTKLTPQWMLKTGLVYTSARGISYGLFNSHFDAYTQRDFTIASTPATNPRSHAYDHLSINIVIPLRALTDDRSHHRSKLVLFGDNLLESAPQYAPDLSRTSIDINTLPIRSGRAWAIRYQIDI